MTNIQARPNRRAGPTGDSQGPRLPDAHGVAGLSEEAETCVTGV